MTDQRPRRIVIDPGVLISAIITPSGPPAELLRAVRAQDVAVVVSPKLLGELREVLARPKFRRYLSVDDAIEYVDGLVLIADLVEDPDDPQKITRDPDDDYLVPLALAIWADALVSGDPHLLEIREPRVATPRALLDRLADANRG